MARTKIGTTDVARAAATAPAATNIDQANGMYIEDGGNADRQTLVVDNTAAADHTVTIGAGVNPPSLRAGLGDLTVTVPTGTTRYITYESGRHTQADGTVNVDFEAGMTGTIEVVESPKGGV